MKRYPGCGNFAGTPRFLPGRLQGAFMSATGELIRLMNYVDDIAATLRRISASIPAMAEEERARLADYMRKSDPNFEGVLQQLEGGSK
jgi:hypothetical protein